MIVTFELNETEIRKILADYLADKLDINFSPDEVPIQTKSKQNYKSEWETASIRIVASVVK